MKQITTRRTTVFLAFWLCLAVALMQTTVAQAATAREGDQGDRVLAVQLRLIDLGYNVPKATGEYDARTARAVMTYQKQARLNQTGVVDEITWHFLMDLNAKALLHVAAAVIPGMCQQQRGSFVTVGAGAALKGGAHMGAYSASKSALIRLTEAMYAEIAVYSALT